MLLQQYPPIFSESIILPALKTISFFSLQISPTHIMCPTGTSLRPDTKKPDLRSAFDVIDVDSDGKISRDDLRKFYGGATDEETIGTMIYAADSNKDGYVGYDEFEKVLGRRKSEEVGVMEEAFRVMDRDGDGKVGHEDLKTYFGLVGLDVGEEDIKAMIRLGGGDDNFNGGVTFDGFLKILAVSS